MIRRDRLLFARLSSVNTAVGRELGEMFASFRHGLPPAPALRALGCELRDVAEDLLARATELDGRTVERQIVAPRPVVVEARTGPEELPAGAGGFPVRPFPPGSTAPLPRSGGTVRPEGRQ
ncbi:hypothetical protein [Amycolatopsis antarctica]|uniref:hypothetical protein n=1 Tax=Amycolatopsis antarctica TaxID=1854586 RepID=UPI0013FDFE52|nr:hypothetical protein [Amycolatopsis antarctica]